MVIRSTEYMEVQVNGTGFGVLFLVQVSLNLIYLRYFGTNGRLQARSYGCIFL